MVVLHFKCELAEKDNLNEMKRLEIHFSLLDENESNQILTLYSKFLMSNKIKKIVFLDNKKV